MTAKTGRGADKFMLRFPDGMRDAMHKLSERNGRSINSEIIVALEKHLTASGFEKQIVQDGYDPRLDTFIAAALSGLLARGAGEIDTICTEARMIGGHMLQIMQEDAN